MRLANVPPPMAQHQITLERNAVDVAISSSTQNDNTVRIAALHDGCCSLYRWSLNSRAQKPPSLVEISSLHARTESPDVMSAQITYGTNGFFMCLTQELTGSKVWLLDEDGGAPPRQYCHFSKAIRGIVTNGPCSDNTTYIMSEQKETVEIDDLEAAVSGVNESNESKLALSPLSHPGIDSISWRNEDEPPSSGLSNGASTHFAKEVIFSLSENGSLFANDRRLIRNCTSFLVTPVHLILTTSRHLLKIVHLRESVAGKVRSHNDMFQLTHHGRSRDPTGHTRVR